MRIENFCPEHEEIKYTCKKKKELTSSSVKRENRGGQSLTAITFFSNDAKLINSVSVTPDRLARKGQLDSSAILKTLRRKQKGYEYKFHKKMLAENVNDIPPQLELTPLAQKSSPVPDKKITERVVDRILEDYVMRSE